jgi:hypothetical protein
MEIVILDSAHKHGISDYICLEKIMAEEYDVDKIVDSVEKAVLAGKSRHATEKESLELRLAALENIVKSCKELVEKIYSDSGAISYLS